MIPPPSAVANDRTIRPSRSSLPATAVKAPSSAKTKVPSKSKVSNSLWELGFTGTRSQPIFRLGNGLMNPKDTAGESMTTSYNQIAGRNLERLAALSDGIFAVAMTLLVLDLHAPAAQMIHTEGALGHALLQITPQLVSYLMSFLTLGIFWHGQQAQLNYFAQSDRHLSWIHIAFLFAVSMMPFSTQLLAAFITYRLALLCYWANVLLLGIVLYISWQHAKRAGLLKDEVTHQIQCAVERRIVFAQALYAAGAALCLVNIDLSIAFIVLVQVNFAIGPRLPFLKKV